MSDQQKAYFGLEWIISMIIAIIPFTSLVGGIITRIQREQILYAVLNFFLFPVFWVVDLVSMILHKDLKILAE